MREEQQRTIQSHADTLDRLTTAVAIFDPNQKLRFFNQAFQKLWDLDHGFLDSAPDNALLLDRLRSDGKIAEQPDWRRWKETLLAVYRSVDPQEHWWHLPDGRTIRVVANPQPNGGVTWVFENLTEKIDLESRYQTLIQVQGETLDNLAEGVAVFGPDGRVRLSNPAFSDALGPRSVARRARHAYLGDSRGLRRQAVRQSVGRFRRRRHRLRRRAAQPSRPGGADVRQGAALRGHPSAQWPDDDDLRRRHRQRQRRARAEGQERGAAEVRSSEERLRPARFLRAALAARPTSSASPSCCRFPTPAR